ncbi:WD40-repeat-containing domain protein [Syncephalastrum racemosum]|uniref:WD40-repeat-containing domain protein n=1 Tax=Syncephalastrum racemosum TaxID=13706 RepID=A0A1X2H5G9_SYNRA|nr:WD40-repeat-containing domain protein [Syncephalastrum racemosum]
MSDFGSNLSDFLPQSFGKSSRKPQQPAKSKSNPVDDDGMAALRDFLPTSFGKIEKSKNVSKQFEKTKRANTTSFESAVKDTELTRAKSTDKKNDISDNSKHDNNGGDDEEGDDDDDDDDSMDSDDEFDLKKLPITHQVDLKDHTRTVSALTLDPAGGRLISGGYDYDLKFWDFAGMNQSFRPFRSIEPCGGNQIHDVQYSLSGDSFLLISGTAQAKLFNRDGFETCEYIKGDPYIRDLRHTAGHVAALTSGAWHPTDKTTFATASQDGTLRIWDVERKRKQKVVIAYKSRERGGRSPATAIAYSPDATKLAGAFQDGTINIWPADGPYFRPQLSVNAHEKHTETSSLLFSRNGHTLVSRGGDDTVKVWDVRNFKQPVKTAYNLESINPETNVVFSPDEKLILTGTSVPKGQGNGQLVMLDRETLEVQRSIDVSQSSVVRVLWHPRINQIITGSQDGCVRVFYSPDYSDRGAKLCVVKEAKKAAVDDYEINRPVITPHALPMFKDTETRYSKRKKEKLRKDPKASHRPEMPVKGPGKGGRVGVNEQQMVIKGFSKDTTRDEDPREALLKYADLAEKEPMWVSNLYKDTQPNAVFQEEETEEDEGKEHANKKQRH